jgi:glutathione S-transferase
MHSGFGALRDRFPMNIEASVDVARECCMITDVAADLRRIEDMWRQQLNESGGPFLFGAFSAADAYFAPVCARLKTYAPAVEADTSAYVERMLTCRRCRRCAAARAEHDFVKEDEPYRDAA